MGRESIFKNRADTFIPPPRGADSACPPLQDANALFVDEDYDGALDLYTQAIAKSPEVSMPPTHASPRLSTR